MSSDQESDEAEIAAMAGAVNNIKGCPMIEDQETYNPADSLDKLGEAATAVGMSQKCVTKANAISQDENTAAKAAAQLTTPFGGGSASFEENRSNSYVDNTMTSAGCQPITLVSNQMKLEQTNMTCNMNTTVSTQDAKALTNLSLRIEALPILDQGVRDSIAAGRKEISDIVDASQAAITTATAGVNADDMIRIAQAAAGDAEILKILEGYLNDVNKRQLELLKVCHEVNVQALSNYDYNNPIASNLTDVDINQTIDSSVVVSSVQNVDSNTISVMKDSMERISNAVAHEELNSKIGPGVDLTNARKLVSKQCEDAFINQRTNIENTITGNSMNIDTNNNITLSIVGPIRGNDIDQAIGSQVSVTVMQSLKKAVEVGQSVAAKIINETITKTIDNRVADGIDKAIAASGKSRADLMDATKTENLADIMKGQGDASATMSGGIGGALSDMTKAAFDGLKGVLGAAMLPIIIIGGIIVVVILYMIFGRSKAPPAPPAGGANFARMASMAKAAAAKGGISRFGFAPLAAMKGASLGKTVIKWGFIIGCIVGAILFIVYKVVPWVKKRTEKRRHNNIVTPAPRQEMPPVDTQPMNSPYQRRELRNFKGDRTARKIPSHKKINQSRNFTRPTQKKHVNMYNPADPGVNIATIHNPTYHFQNKVDDKPVAYFKKSRV